MADALDRLAARHATGRRRKPKCPRCNERTTDARLLVQVKRTVPKEEGKKADETVISSVRTMCQECVAELYEQFVEALPEQAWPGGRP